MAELKTRVNQADVTKFINSVADERQRADCIALVEVMRSVTKQEPKMWGAGMVGFGSYHYVYASGHEGDWFWTGFAPRKGEITIHIMAGFDAFPDLMKQLGKYKIGKSCLYVKKLEDVHMPTLKKLIRESVKHISKKKWP